MVLLLMRNCRHVLWFVTICLLAVGSLSPSIGCGDSRPKIRRPENPTSPPDDSMRLHMQASQQHPTEETEKPAE